MTSEGRRITRRTRLVEAFVSPDSYGLVLVLIVATYALAVSQGSSPVLGSVVVFVQIATVWFVLRTARAHRAARATAFVILIVAGVVAVTGGVLGGTGSQLAILLASTVLYLIAPIVVVRHLIGRSVVDRETVLGVIAAYLLIGMFFAFVYRVGRGRRAGSLLRLRRGGEPIAGALLQLHDVLDDRLRQPRARQAALGQTLAVAEMIIGQLFLITALGKVVSVWSPIRKTADEAPTSRRRLRIVLATAVGERLAERRQLRPDARELLRHRRLRRRPLRRGIVGLGLGDEDAGEDAGERSDDPDAGEHHEHPDARGPGWSRGTDRRTRPS